MLASVILLLWCAMQALTVLGVANYRRHVPHERLTEGSSGVVAIVSVRGPWPNAAAFVASVLNQEGAAARLLLAVSGADDPAWATLDTLRCSHPDRIEIVVAGVSTTEGQKIHKLRAAITALRADDRLLVFLDADIVPPARLIGRLLFPIVRGKTDISTGYRLLLPQRARPIQALVAAVDLQVATLPRPPQGTLPWGGAMAMTRAAFDDLGIARAWEGRLSDDLTVARLARATRLGIRPVRDLLIASPMTGSSSAALAFAVRQYRHLFWNMPTIWLAAAAIAAAQAAGWLWALGWGGWPAVAVGYLAAWARAALRNAIIESVLPIADRRVTLPTLAWDCLLPFVVVFTHSACVLLGPTSRYIRWGTFRYRMGWDGRVSQVDPIT